MFNNSSCCVTGVVVKTASSKKALTHWTVKSTLALKTFEPSVESQSPPLCSSSS